MLLVTRNVGLAAWIDLNHGKFVSKVKGLYSYESDVSLKDYERDYFNSLCVKHNESVVRLLSIKN